MAELTAAGLLDALRDADTGDVRAVVWYDADDYDILHHREDVAETYTDEELDEVVRNLVLKGYDDPTEQPELLRFGHLDATVRWFDEVVAVQVPTGEWSGVLVTVDRESLADTNTLVDTVLGFVESPESGIDAGTTDADIEDQFD